MKKIVKFLGMFAVVAMVGASTVKAQGLEFNAGVDLYSKYLWRGLSFGTGPQIQPTLSAKMGSLTIGYWGSYDLVGAGYTESDLFITYATSFGLTLTTTDYSTGSKYFKTGKEGDHAQEIAASYAISDLTLTGAYIINEALLPGTKGGDTYVEAAYTFAGATLAVGAGNGWYSITDNFNVCNVSLKKVKEIKVSEGFTLPVTGILMLNPNTETISIGAGLTF